MKPIKLKIKGLNSFIEEQVIDFEKLTDRGFFGIFGPTGSGKSTILDGITLALYGNVSRKSSNYINTNCDRLNVNFEFQISGAEIKRYIVDREFRRKNDGSINSGKCKIVDITNQEEEVLADGVKTINKKVEEIIGLNLEDFTRTVVLPQGKFSEFLKLEGKDRRDMLERLFNLEKYGDNLSRKLNLKISKERTDNNVLIGQLSGYNDISEDKLIEKKEMLTELENNLANLKSELEIIEKIYKENEELWNLQLELIEYNDKEKNLKGKQDEINEYIEKIKLGEAGEKVIPYIKAFESTIKEFHENEIELDNLKLAIDKVKEERERIEELWKKAKDNKENKLPTLMIDEQKVKDAIEEKKLIEIIQNKINNLMVEVKEFESKSKNFQSELINIDSEIKNKTKEIKENEKTYDDLKVDERFKEKIQQGIITEEKLGNIKVTISKDKEKKDSIEKENNETVAKGKTLKNIVEKINKDLEENEKKYEYLLKNSPGEQNDLVNLNQLIVENDQKWKIYAKSKNEIKESKVEIKSLSVEIINKKEKVKKQEEELEKIKNKQKEIMRENLAHALREELIEGEICPVCGSTHHNKENIKQVEILDLTAIENEIKSKENSIKDINNKVIQNETKISNFNEKIKISEEEIIKLGTEFKEKPLDNLKTEFTNLKNALEKYIQDKEMLEKGINNLKTEINTKDGEIKELRAVFSTNQRQIKDLENNIKENAEELDKLENTLKLLRSETDVSDFNKKNEQIKTIEKEREKLTKVIKSNRELVESLEKKKAALNEELTSIKENLAKDSADLAGYEKNKEEKLRSIKNKVNDVEDLDSLLNKIQKDIHNINIQFELVENNKNRVEKEFTDYNDKLIAVISKDKDLKKRKEDEEAWLELALDSEGFNSLEEVKKNLIEKDEIKKYKEKVEDYNNNIARVTGTIESLLKKINGKEITEENYEQIKSSKNAKEKEVNEVNENKIKVDEELKNIKEKLEAQKELLEKKKKIERKLSLLGDLEKLFKGKKFVEFVAANKLKYVSIEASKRLKEITNGNYGLEVDENGRFIIRDYKNGGAKRDATTLSGGETFLASLALALALSAQIQLKGTAPLELFFLDEGFGTLDDDLLEVVMSSLERIHNERLKVGIISHVESIKNRVPVKLMITPAESGMGGSKVKIERS
ncbi:nuclease SbcCD subunit C [Clostridium puniceum]|uniref:Nuclease SbcCD subunit C n=1 Tax=Clostridium puniceum TaxID=29367 RepID=A0A1S8T9B5_9CLOT|nr:SbcC/MukB-like Walker B domain-containing protein [Clostridium puniceum]OOM74346.1 nuclease SbcCD subunit C [Clostridium puniceum]